MKVKYIGPWYIAYYDDNGEPAQYHRDELGDPDMGPILYVAAGPRPSWIIDHYFCGLLPKTKRPIIREFETAEESMIVMDKVLTDLGYEFLDQERYDKLSLLT